MADMATYDVHPIRGRLTPELLDLMEHEKVIEQGLASFVEVGSALLAIREGKKYRAAGFDTFETYCRQRWDISRSRAHRLMDAAELLPAMLPTGNIPTPRSERQVRELAPLRDEPERVAEAWQAAVEVAGGEQPTARQVAAAVAEITHTPPPTERPVVTKPDLGDGISHPARYSEHLIPVFAQLLEPGWTVLDPFAGTGKIHRLREYLDVTTVGIEIEPEWAQLHPDTQVGDALDLPFDDATFDAIVTSPTYGNRLADRHIASDPDRRRSYTHDLGRILADNNSGGLQWGDDYRTFHERAWLEAIRVLRPGGRLVLNIKDHVRGGARQYVTSWHIATLLELGLVYAEAHTVDTAHLRQGTNAEARVDGEQVIALDRP